MSKRSASGLSNRYTSRDFRLFPAVLPASPSGMPSSVSRWDQAGLLVAFRGELLNCRGSIWRSTQRPCADWLGRRGVRCGT